MGTVRTDLVAGVCELSWTVDPAYRGCGIGKAMVTKAVASISGPIRAEVKVDNHASRRIAEACGMTLASARGGILHFWKGPAPKSRS